ncbi:MAG: ABC transporter substrate-binding protein [Bacteriovoracia bacterium]
MRKIVLVSLGVIAVLFSQACATAQISNTKEHNKREKRKSSSRKFDSAKSSAFSDEKEKKDFTDIESSYRERKTDRLLKQSKKFVQNYSQSKYLDRVYLYRALAFISKKEYSNAAVNLRHTAELTDDSLIRQMSLYNLAFCDFEQHHFDKSEESLNKVDASDLDEDNQIKFFILKAKVNRELFKLKESALNVLEAIDIHGKDRTPNQLKTMIGFLDEVTSRITSLDTFNELIDRYSSLPGSDRLYYRAGTLLFRNGHRTESKTYFEKVVDNFADSPYLESAKEFLRKMEFAELVDANKIGVLLTRSGKFEKFGEKALQGIEFAFKEFKRENPDTKLELVVVDDKGDTEGAQEALDELFYKHHVLAVIGPMLSKLSEAIGVKAQEMGLPLISLTQIEAKGGDFVFNMGLTPHIQLAEVIRYAVSARSFKTLAGMVANSRFGEEYFNAFWDEIERSEISVRAFEHYPPEETDFRVYIDRMVGLSYPDSRTKEYEELAAMKENILATTKGTSMKKLNRIYTIKPIVDFDAVFIPDEPKVLGQILPTFAYRDVEKMQFIGNNTWNNPELIARGGHFVEGAVFVDGYYNESTIANSVRFREGFFKEYQTYPTVIEAGSYDAAKLVVSLAQRAPVMSRQEMRNRLAGFREFPGINGRIIYAPSRDGRGGRILKRLQFLTVKDGKITEFAF